MYVCAAHKCAGHVCMCVRSGTLCNKFMCVCVHENVQCMYVCMCTAARCAVHARMYVCLCTAASKCMYACVCMRSSTKAYVSMSVCSSRQVYVCMYLCSSTHVHMCSMQMCSACMYVWLCRSTLFCAMYVHVCAPAIKLPQGEEDLSPFTLRTKPYINYKTTKDTLSRPV